MPKFSTAKREDKSKTWAFDQFNEAFDEAEKKSGSKWKAFVASKPVQSVISGARSFKNWTATKLRDFGSDMKVGAKAFSEHYRERQQQKRIDKYAAKCEAMGFAVVSQEELDNFKKTLDELSAAQGKSEPIAEAVSESTKEPLKIKLKPKQAEAEPVSAEAENTDTEAKKPVVIKLKKKDNEAVAEKSTVDTIKENLTDEANNGLDSGKVRNELENIKQFCQTVYDSINDATVEIDKLETEDQKREYAQKFIQQLSERFSVASKLSSDFAAERTAEIIQPQADTEASAEDDYGV